MHEHSQWNCNRRSTLNILYISSVHFIFLHKLHETSSSVGDKWLNSETRNLNDFAISPFRLNTRERRVEIKTRARELENESEGQKIRRTRKICTRIAVCVIRDMFSIEREISLSGAFRNLSFVTIPFFGRRRRKRGEQGCERTLRDARAL
mgnify:CR=1 FL=1